MLRRRGCCDQGILLWFFQTLASAPQCLSGKKAQMSKISGIKRRTQTDGQICWLVVWNIFYFSIYWDFHHPNRLSYFSEGLNKGWNSRAHFVSKLSCMTMSRPLVCFLVCCLFLRQRKHHEIGPLPYHCPRMTPVKRGTSFTSQQRCKQESFHTRCSSINRFLGGIEETLSRGSQLAR